VGREEVGTVSDEQPLRDQRDVRASLDPLLEGRVLDWGGLPVLNEGSLVEVFGPPAESEDVVLGWYPARRLRFGGGGNPFEAFVRDLVVVLVRPVRLPGPEVLDPLGEPSVVMPHELRRDGAYVHEYVYGPRGLVLSVAQPFDETEPLEVVRCGGIRPLRAGQRLGPELHRSLEDRTAW
jgi:hypothetical protein